MKNIFPPFNAGPLIPGLLAMLLCLAVIPGGKAWAAPAKTKTASPAKDPISLLWSRLTPDSRKVIGVPLENLKPDGRELARTFLQPLATGKGPLEPQFVETNASKRAVRDQAVLELLMQNKVSLHGSEPQDLGKNINWLHAPRGDLQWPTHLSRHYWLISLAWAWRATHDESYSAKVVDVLLDWIKQNGLDCDSLHWHSGEGFFKKSDGTFYADGPWTSLSAQARVEYWSILFQLLWDAPQMTNEAVAAFLYSLDTDHRLMMIQRPRGMNQFYAIASSLIHLGWWYPCLQNSAEAERIGWERIAKYTDREIYPDGSMAECSPGYSQGCFGGLFNLWQEGRERRRAVPKIIPERLRPVMRYFASIADSTCFEGLFNLWQEGRGRRRAVSKIIPERLRPAMRYFASIANPAGNTPRIAQGGYPVWNTLRKVNAVFHDPQVDYMISGGQEGQKPAYNSIAFNWAGHVVFRSGWDTNATWMFFEPGPRGNGHSDLAQLSVQLMAGGDWLLTDPGFFTYSDAGEDGAMGAYLNSTMAHNTLLVDGKGQRYTGPNSPPDGINQKEGDYHFTDNGETVSAEGAYTYGFGPQGEIAVTHHRRITYEPANNRFLFADTCSGQGSHDFAAHWQFPADARVTVETNNVIVVTGHVRMTMQFASDHPLQVDIVRGQKAPEIGGWFSQHYGHLVEAPLGRVRWRSKLPTTLRTTLTIESDP